MLKKFRKQRAKRRYQVALKRQREYLATKTMGELIEYNSIKRYIRSM